MNQLPRVYYAVAIVLVLAPRVSKAATLLSSGTFQAGPVTCSAFSTKPDEITLPAHCLTGLNESVVKTYTDVDTGSTYDASGVSLVLKSRDTAILSLQAAITPRAGFPTRVIQSELQAQFIEQQGYALYDRRLFAGDSGTPILRGTDVIGMHIGSLDGFGVGILFGTDEPLPHNVALGVERQFFCGANCTIEECVSAFGVKKCISVEEPVCASARDTHCALLALLDLLRSELLNLRNLLFGKQTEAITWQQAVNNSQTSVNTKTTQLNNLNSNIASKTTQITSTQNSITQTTNAISSVNTQITSTVAQQASTTTNINAKKVVKVDTTANLASLNNSIAVVNGQIELNTQKVAELQIVKSAETATKFVRETTFAADELAGSNLIAEIKELNTASIAIVGASLPEIQKTATEYFSDKSPAVADFLSANIDQLLQVNHDLATNVTTLPSITENLEGDGSGYEAIVNNFLSEARKSRELITTLAQHDPILGPLEERITKELNGDGILHSDKTFWEAMISENSETAKFSDWLAQADSKTQTWFAERDEAMQEYFADRDEAFRDWIETVGGWPNDVDTYGKIFSEQFKDGANHISIVYKDSGQELSEGAKAIHAELEFILTSCTSDLRTAFKEFRFQSGEFSTDLVGLLNLETSAPEELLGAQALFATSVAIWTNKLTTKCLGNIVVPQPAFKSPTKPTLSTDTKQNLQIMIDRISGKLFKDVEEFPVTGVPNFDQNNSYIYPKDREFPGVCGGLITESGNLSFHKTTHQNYQTAGKNYLINEHQIAPNLCNNGDGIKFTGLLYSVLPLEKFRNGIRDSFDIDGRPHRSRYHKEIHHTLGKAGGAYSKDMTMGLSHYFLSSKDRELAERFHSFITNSNNFICDILPSFHPNLAKEKVSEKPDGTEDVEKIKWRDQFGNCYLTPSILNNFDRIRRNIGLDFGEENNLQFLIDVEIIRQAAGLPESEEFTRARIEMNDRFSVDAEIFGQTIKNRIDADVFYQDSLDFEIHLASLNILLFSDLGLLTQGLADAAEKMNERWHSRATEVDHNVENLFFQFLDNYTNQGNQQVFENIASKLIRKMECWDYYKDNAGQFRIDCWDYHDELEIKPIVDMEGNPIVDTDGVPIEEEIFDWRRGWSWQREPKEGNSKDKYLSSQTSNPFGHDLLFLAKLLLSNEGTE